MLKLTSARVLVIGFLAATGFTATLFADHSWGSYHWARTSNPFTLKVGDNVSSAWDPYLAGAASDWSGSSVLDLTVVAGRTRPRNCKATLGRIEACSERYGSTGWLGIAQIWISGVHIVQATTKVNDTYFNTATYNNAAWRRLVMCQEIAHDFGLDHQDEEFDNANLGSCMDYTNAPDSNQYPNAHDFEQLELIYTHLDATSTVDSTASAMPPAMGQIAFDTPAQWGRLIRSSANGRAQVYELDFGRGNKVVTHVFWADPDADAR